MKKVAPLKALLCAFFCFLLLIPAISGCKEKNDINDNPLIPSESQKEEDKPTLYVAKSSIIATNGGISSGNDQNTVSKIGSADLASSLAIIDTYIDVMKTYRFYEAVVEQPDVSRFGYSSVEIRNMTKIERRNYESLFIDITVYNESPKTAVILANCIASTAPDYISNMLPGASVVVADKCISAKPVE